MKRAEAEKAEIQANTAKVIASLTELNAQREGEFSSLQENLQEQLKVKEVELDAAENEPSVNKSFNFPFKGGSKSKSKKLQKQIEKLEDDAEELRQKIIRLESDNKSLKKKE